MMLFNGEVERRLSKQRGVAAGGLHITINGTQGSGKTAVADRIDRVLGLAGFKVSRKQEGVFVGGAVAADDARPHAVVEEIQTEPRRATFFGTTSSEDFLKDDDGWRRWFPIDGSWGEPIQVDGARPTWLRDDDRFQIQFATCGGCWHEGEPSDFCRVQRIRLPVDHAYYTATSLGFTYWSGGGVAPTDWDGGNVLRRGKPGATFHSHREPWAAPYSHNQRWFHYKHDASGRFADIIGYRKRVDPIVEAQIHGDPLPATEETATIEISLNALTAEVTALRSRRDELLRANNDLVEARRAAERERNEWKSLWKTLNRRLIDALTAAQPVDDELQSPDLGETEGQWVFGAWVTPTDSRSADLCLESHWQMRGNESGVVNPEIYPSLKQKNPSMGTDYRRAFRIGEWVDHQPGTPCPVAPETRVEVQYVGNPSTTEGPAENRNWAHVARWRPVKESGE